MPQLDWFDFNILLAWWPKAAAWLEVRLLSWETLFQLALILLLAAFSAVIARRLSSMSRAWLERTGRHTPFHTVSLGELYFLLLLVVLMLLAVPAFEQLALPFSVLAMAVSLLSAWFLIRLTSGVIKSPFWSNTVAIGLWVVAALNILGWIDPAAMLLDKAAFSIGSFRLSLLVILKGVVAFTLLLWLAHMLSRLLEKRLANATALTPSQRVLFIKLFRMLLIALVVLLGLQVVGLDITTLAVFGGALGLGIGFGLQKVVSNLLSGIILLMDRSVKPGDVIAVGQTYGWVNTLGARHVSVITRDGKEHLIPNEILITEQVENWSYSDSNIRIHIPIGVSYRSDIHLARKLMLEVTKEHPRVLKYPPPTCLLREFGESAVKFEIRAWIEDPANGIANVMSDIYLNIWDRFRENRIEIPFPQRDVHLKTDGEFMEALAARLAEKMAKK